MPVYNHYYPDTGNLINTPDSATRLATEGPLLPVTISVPPSLITVLQAHNRPVPPPMSGQALIDSGASLCMVDEQVARSFGLPPFGTMPINTPAGPTQCATYPASLSFPGTPLPNVEFFDFITGPLQGQGIIALIGRNVLRDFVFIYNGPGGCISLAY
jgi:hypothetical protein